MQIHELQEYSGVPGSGSVLAIDDGTNTRKIVPGNLGIQTEMTQAEAEAGTSTAKRILTPQVFHDAVLGIVNASNTGRIWYGTCPTAAGGSGGNSKIVTVEEGFQLIAGATIAVKFNNAALSAAGYTRSLNVNGTGDVPIRCKGETTFNFQLWESGDVVIFVYDGTNWQMISAPPSNSAAGRTAGISVASGATADVNITFGKTFLVPPSVVVGFQSSSTAGAFGRCTCSVMTIETTGCSLRVFNGDTTVRAPSLMWTAIGL